MPASNNSLPRVTDNDRDEISVTLGGKELRGWSYSSDAERRTKMLAAREYVEGYCDGRDALANVDGCVRTATPTPNAIAFLDDAGGGP